MYKVTLPIDVNASRYGIDFKRGVGLTGDERIVELMRKKGFKAELVELPETPESAAAKPKRGKT